MLNQKVDPVVSSDPYLRVTLTSSLKEVLEATNYFVVQERSHCIYIFLLCHYFTDTRKFLNSKVNMTPIFCFYFIVYIIIFGA